MNKLHTALCLALLAGLTACGKKDPAPATTGAEPQTAIGKVAGKAIEQARQELATQNLSLDGSFNFNGHKIGGNDNNDPSRPKGEITPQGDLLIDGKAVTITPEQRAQLLEYRKNLLGVAEAGMAIGLKGADLAGKALTGSLGSILSGDTKEFEKKMEAEGKKLEAEAEQICVHLPAVLVAQDKLAASLPEFKPYATMTQDDVNDCGKDKDGNNGDANANDAQQRAEVKQAIRDEIRSGIRNGVREAARAGAQAATNETAGSTSN